MSDLRIWENEGDKLCGVVPGRLPTIQWIVPHPWEYEQHKLDLVGYKSKMTEQEAGRWVLGSVRRLRNKYGHCRHFSRS